MQKMLLAVPIFLWILHGEASDVDTELWFADQVVAFKVLEGEDNYFPWQAEGVPSNESIASNSCGLYSLKFRAFERIGNSSGFRCKDDCPRIFSLLDEYCRPGVNFDEQYSVIVVRKHGERSYLLRSFVVNLDSDDSFYLSAKSLMSHFAGKQITDIPKDKQECIDLDYLSKNRLESIVEEYFAEIRGDNLCFIKGIYLF